MGRQRYFDGLSSLFGLPAEQFSEPGTTIALAADRRGRRRVSHHRVGRRSVFWIDPELEAEFEPWRSLARPVPFEEFGDWARSAGASFLGHGFDHLLRSDFVPAAWAPELVALDGASPERIAIVRTLLDDCSEDDIDEAEFEIDALDPYLVGWVENGRLLALAGGRPEPVRPGCMDIGVLVHADARRSGRGRAVVAATVDEIMAAGQVPLYRCNIENTGSSRLCRSVGFETVLEIEGFEWPAARSET